MLGMLAMASAVRADEPTKEDKNDPDRLICRWEEKIGTRLVTNRRCATKAQWDEARRLNRRAIEHAQNLRYKSF
ncbi:MAG: hypothetical protein EOP61_19425 [Sphingomonadales bacterium]|nr:MAG: hypothetical protein EOP61_19425 [Sphingomonadales bacterium]